MFAGAPFATRAATPPAVLSAVLPPIFVPLVVFASAHARSHVCMLDAASPSTHQSLSYEQVGELLGEKRCKLLTKRRRQKLEYTDGLKECDPNVWATRSLHSTRLPNLPLNRCHLADSHIPGAGRGVFASEALQAGTLITLYPGDAIRIDAAIAGFNHVSCCAAAPDGSLILPDASLLRRARSYEIEIASPLPTEACAISPPLTSVLGDPDRADDPAYLGHMLNDGATCADEAVSAIYISESSVARNAEPRPVGGCHLAIVATRDVQQGEELLLTYGVPFWLAELGGAAVSDAASDDDVDADSPHRHSRRGRARGDAEDDGGLVRDRRKGKSRRGRRGRTGRTKHAGGSDLVDDDWSGRTGG